MLIPLRAGTGAELRKGLFGAGKRTDEMVITILFLPGIEQAARASFLSELLLYKERSCLRARILELPPARHPAGLCFSQASRDTHGKPRAGLAPQKALPCTLCSSTLWTQEHVPAPAVASGKHLEDVTCGQQQEQDLRAAPSRQDQSKPRPMAQTLS